jgi:hypothetical protein
VGLGGFGQLQNHLQGDFRPNATGYAFQARRTDKHHLKFRRAFFALLQLGSG